MPLWSSIAYIIVWNVWLNFIQMHMYTLYTIVYSNLSNYCIIVEKLKHLIWDKLQLYLFKIYRISSYKLRLINMQFSNSILTVIEY